jgi:DNA repair protein RAD7
MKDCTNIDPQGFLVLANLCPSLTSLTLNLCGQLSDDSLVGFATKLPSLKRIELLGPFLVRKPAWIDFFTEIGPRLEGFLVRQSPRLDEECIEILVRSAGDRLSELRLSEMGRMDESWLTHLARLRGLKSLDLSYPLVPLPAESAALQDLIAAVGPGLTALNLAGQSNLTSADLLALPNLTRLDLTLLDLLTDEETVAVLTAWADAGNVGLESVKLGKAHLLLGPTLNALIALAGRSLQELEISGWKDLDEGSLKAVGHNCPGLTRLDVGWCSE